MGRLAVFILATWLAVGLSVGEADAATKTRAVAAKKHGVKHSTKPAVKSVQHAGRPAAKPVRRAHLSKVKYVPEPAFDRDGDPILSSASALVVDQTSGTVLYEKNAAAQVPIASITKLMTAMVALDAKPDLQKVLTISEDDVDSFKGTRSRLRVGTQLTREELLLLALMSSENRAAAALSRYYVGGREEFVADMNRKAQALGLTDTRFEDPTGLTAANVSSARDLTKLVAAAHRYPLIRELSTTPEYTVTIAGRPQAFHNTNALVRNDGWEIGLSKTGYINEAGKCLVMQAWVNNRPTIIVLLDSWGKLTRIGDANRLKRWMESAALPHKPIAG